MFLASLGTMPLAGHRWRMNGKGGVLMAATTDLNARDDELAMLRDKYPGWHIWMSQARRLWATRKGRISPEASRDCRWSMTVDADTSEDLGEQLQEQILLEIQ
jgi:hypothetical protein